MACGQCREWCVKRELGNAVELMRYAVDFCVPLVSEGKLEVVDGTGPLSEARYVERIGQIPESLSKGEWVSWTLDCTNCRQRFWLGGQLGRGARWNYESEDERTRRDSPAAPSAPPESPEPRKRRWGRG